MECQKCQIKMLPEWRFCPVCGTPELKLMTADIDKIFSDKLVPDDLLSDDIKLKQKERDQMFEIAARHAIAGEDWYERCASLLKRNGITVDEVQKEATRRLRSK